MSLTRAQYDTIAARVADGWSNKEIAAAMAVTVNQVRYAVSKMGLASVKRRRPSRWTVEWADAIVRGEIALSPGSAKTRRRAEAMVAEAG